MESLKQPLSPWIYTAVRRVVHNLENYHSEEPAVIVVIKILSDLIRMHEEIINAEAKQKDKRSEEETRWIKRGEV